MLRLSAGWRSGPVLRVLSALSLSGVVAVAAAELVLRLLGLAPVNAGLGGATITDEVELVQRALPLTPDLVVVVFSENDVTDLGQTPMWTLLAANRRAKSRFPLSLVYPVLRHTALWNLGLEVAGK